MEIAGFFDLFELIVNLGSVIYAAGNAICSWFFTEHVFDMGVGDPLTIVPVEFMFGAAVPIVLTVGIIKFFSQFSPN